MQTSIGSLYPQKVYGATRPRGHWEIQSKPDCVALTRVLDLYPLRTRKQDAYMVWKRAVFYWTRDEDSGERHEALSYLRTRLLEVTAGDRN